MNRRSLLLGTIATAFPWTVNANPNTYAAQEQWLADGEWQNYLKAKLDYSGIIVGPHSDSEYIRAMREIAEPIMQINTRLGLDWRVGVIERDDIVNACTYGGGVIFMFSGIVQLCQTETELATVIAHEVGHVEYRHTIQRLMAIDLFRKSGFQPGQDKKAIAKQVFLNRYDHVAPELAWSSYRRLAEFEADAHSVKALAETNYDVALAHNLFERLMLKFPQSENTDNCLISSHPLSKERIARIRGLARRHGKYRGRPRHSEAFQYMKSITG